MCSKHPIYICRCKYLVHMYVVCTCLNDGLSPALLGHSNENITRDSKDIGWCSNLVSIRKKYSEPMFRKPHCNSFQNLFVTLK